MGYHVSSVTIISPDDYHSYFAYYLPTDRLHYEWINKYFADNFNLIADKIGPNGVIVAPNIRAVSDYAAELTVLLKRFYAGGLFLHSGFPFLVISRRPIYPDMPQDSSADPNFIALNLAAVRDEAELGKLIDTLIQAGLRQEKDILPLISGLAKDLSREYDSQYGGWSDDFSDAIELKPNVMGVGVNVNLIIHEVQKFLRMRRERKLNKKIGPV